MSTARPVLKGYLTESVIRLSRQYGIIKFSQPYRSPEPVPVMALLVYM
jgi:hypothetical protein